MGKSRSLSNMSRQAFRPFAAREGTPPGLSPGSACGMGHAVTLRSARRTAATCAATGNRQLHSVTRSTIRGDILVCVSVDCLWCQAARRVRNSKSAQHAACSCCHHPSHGNGRLRCPRPGPVRTAGRGQAWGQVRVSRAPAMVVFRSTVCCGAPRGDGHRDVPSGWMTGRGAGPRRTPRPWRRPRRHTGPAR
jgi:hypothetical protein